MWIEMDLTCDINGDEDGAFCLINVNNIIGVDLLKKSNVVMIRTASRADIHQLIFKSFDIAMQFYHALMHVIYNGGTWQSDNIGVIKCHG